MNVASSPTAVGSPRWPAPSRGAAPFAPPAPAGPGAGGWLAAQGRLPLAFMGLALAWLAAATLLLATHAPWLALPHAAPWVVVLTHAWVLGVFVTVACGAVYQLAPVALGTTLWSERRAWAHLALHAAGVPAVVWGFWRWNLPTIGAGGLLVGVGVVLFAENTWRTVVRSGRRDAVAWSLALAAGWLVLTVLMGLTLAANRFWGFLAADPVALLRAHAHLGLVGFFVTLLQGVTFRLVPMFTLGDVRDWRPVKVGLWLSQLGLLGLAPALALTLPAAIVITALMILAGLASSGWALVGTLRTRKKRAFDPGIQAFLRGLIGLLAAAVAGVVLAWPSSRDAAPGGFGPMIYALLGVAGGLLPAIAGMMCKIVPFLTWMRAYGPKVGRMPTPAAASLTRPRLEGWAFGLQAAALAPLVAGAWLLNEPVLWFGAWLLAAGVALFVADLLGVLWHLIRPVSVAPALVRGGAP